MFFIACYFETVNKQPSHLSGVQQWRQSPHDVEVLKESSIAITVTIIQWSTVHSCSNCLLNQAHSQLARQGRVWDYGSNVWQKAPAVGDCHSSHSHQFCQRRRALVYPVWKVMWKWVHVQRTPVAHSPPPALTRNCCMCPWVLWQSRHWLLELAIPYSLLALPLLCAQLVVMWPWL